MFLAVNQSLQNGSKKKRKRRPAGQQDTDSPDSLADDPAAIPPRQAIPPLDSSASSDQLVLKGSTGECQVCQCPGRKSLVLIYIYLGALSLILASLTIVFYTQDQSGSVPIDSPARTRAFRAQFQAELVRSEDVLRTMVSRLLEAEQEQQQQDQDQARARAHGSSDASSGPNAGSFDPLKNERKFTDNLISHTPRPTGKRMRRDVTSSEPTSSMHGELGIETGLRS